MRLAIHQLIPLERYALVIALIWTILVGGLLAEKIGDIRQTTRDIAVNQAGVHLSRDQVLRFWAASHGGVYVPESESTRPSPYLEGIPERDIVTPSGRKLTLLNPAYMLRQLNESFAETLQVQGHLTSLRPLRPENRADAWESQALARLGQGEKEVLTFTPRQNLPYLRLMRPMVAAQTCLKCHARQGYQAGDIVGGISVALPMSPFLEREHRQIWSTLFSFALLWLFGLAGISIAARRLQKKLEELERVEEEKSKIAASLARSNRDLEDFAHIVSHDLQEPLNLIKAFSNRLEVKCKSSLPAQGCEYLHRIEMTANRMQDLINGLLTYSRVTTHASPCELIDLAAVIKEVLADLEIRLEQTKGLVEVSELASVEADPLQIRQLLQNLIGNALKYHHPDKTPHVRIYSEILPKEAGRPATCRLTIEDQGIGFEEKYQERIFKIFQRLHDQSQYEGVGLGLTICKKIVERHDGSIWAKSAVGQGTKFIVELPLRRSR